jgi:hypothetical protein
MTDHLLNFDPKILNNVSIRLHNILNEKMQNNLAYQMMINQGNMYNQQYGFNGNGTGEPDVNMGDMNMNTMNMNTMNTMNENGK